MTAISASEIAAPTETSTAPYKPTEEATRLARALAEVQLQRQALSKRENELRDALCAETGGPAMFEFPDINAGVTVYVSPLYVSPSPEQVRIAMAKEGLGKLAEKLIREALVEDFRNKLPTDELKASLCPVKKGTADRLIVRVL